MGSGGKGKLSSLVNEAGNNSQVSGASIKKRSYLAGDPNPIGSGVQPIDR